MVSKPTNKANYTYMPSIAPKTITDKILLTIWRGGLKGLDSVSLKEFRHLHSARIHFCTTSGYIKHEGDGFYSLTKVGQARLESAYKKLPTNHNFYLGEVE